MQEIIRHLQPLELTLLNGCVVEIKPKLLLTMVDGKVSCILTRTAYANCPICRCGRHDFNDLDNID